MNKGNVNKILYIVITVLIIWIIGSVFVAMLPWLILGGLVLWGFFKVKKIFGGKKAEKSGDNMYYKEEVKNEDTVYSEQVIDVEYEEIKK